MVGVALLGAGIFAKEEHLPAIEACSNMTLKAVYSRSQTSASALASAHNSALDTYFDNPSSNDRTLDALLSRSDISTVVIALPITAQPPIIKKALRAGKHVLSEKPIAKDVETAKDLINFYKQLGNQKPIWAVGENLKFVEGLVIGAEKLKQIGGEVTTFAVEMFTFVDESNKWYNTEWRRTPDYQGGFILDGGVHFVAGLRLLLNAVGQDISSLTAKTDLVVPILAPVDTVHAVLTTPTGRSGTISMSWATEFKSGLSLQVVTTNGSVAVSATDVKIKRKGQEEETIQYKFSMGVKQEMEAFSASLLKGKVNAKQSIEEALKDLQVLEGMLKSGETGKMFTL
ncbi:NAD(P)-binding protein [Pyrenochaeta sp. DS3sAY3a]|nr:NAD(P)-binding protein [Pyrenochaeta sp. DS3sAY3a]